MAYQSKSYLRPYKLDSDNIHKVWYNFSPTYATAQRPFLGSTVTQHNTRCWNWSPHLKTLRCSKRQIISFKLASRHQNQLSQPIFKIHQLTLSNLHPYTVIALPKQRERGFPFPWGKARQHLPFVLPPPYSGCIYWSYCSWFSFILKALWSLLNYLPNAWTLHLSIWSLKEHLGIGINTRATAELSLRKSQPYSAIIKHIPNKTLIRIELFQGM